MKALLTLILSLLFLSAFSQADYQYLNVQRRFTLANRTVKGISNDTAWLVGSADSLVTQYAVQGYIANNFSRGGSFAYNFNPEQFIQNGQDISIRFPQDPGEPLFTGSPAFNFTQQHLDFLDSLMLAVGQDTYLDDRDFYYSSDTLNPIRWKAFTFSTTGTGAASWDSANRHLNIPVSSGSGGGSSSPYYLPYNGDTSYYLAGDTSLRKLPAVKNAAYKLPYNGDSTFYLAGDSMLHPLPPTPPPGDSIDYSFTSMTTIYNEAGPGEYTITTSGVTANKDNLTFPFRQLKALDIGGWGNGDYVSFKNTGSANSTAYTFLRGFVRLKQTVPIIQSLSFQFYKNGTPVSQTVSMVNYGLNKSKANVYQNITIPMSAFQFTSNDFDEIRLIFGGGSSADGLYLDLFQFQNATVNENTYVTDLFKQAGTDSVYKVLGGQNVFAFRDSAGAAIDTIHLSDRINLKLNIADTLNKWAAKVHTHSESDVTNLVSDLAGKEPTITAGTTLQYWRGDKTWQTLNTDAVAEATNKYYTDTRARAALTLTTTGTSGAATYNSTTGVLNVPQYATTVGTISWLGTTYNINNSNNITLPAPTTTQVSEGTNLYYTDARARAAISVTGSGGSYNNTTGVITLTGGSGSGWSLSGNAVQTGSSSTFGDFIGSTNLKSLRFRTNNTEYMVLDSLGTLNTTSDISVKGLRLGTGKNSDLTNTVFGNLALNAVTTGATNSFTAIGYKSFTASTNASFQNTGVGYSTGATVTTGTANTAVGANAMYSTSIGATNNVAAGLAALGQITGSNNIGIGVSAGRNSGSGGVFLGYQAGQSETGNNKLYINNGSSGGLIVGDFSTGQLQINAETRNVTPAATGLTTAASFEVNNNPAFLNKGSIPAPRMTQAQRDAIALQTGVVTKIYVTVQGSPTSAPSVLISGSGTGATATAVFAGGGYYINVTNGGIGYTPNSTTVSITGGGTSGATGYAVVGNAGLQVTCLDCIANDGTPTVLQTWNGTAWKNAW